MSLHSKTVNEILSRNSLSAVILKKLSMSVMKMQSNISWILIPVIFNIVFLLLAIIIYKI